MAAIIIGGLGLYYYFLGQADSLNMNGKNYTVITQNTIDKTAGWKTYEVKDLGISFKYPKEWGEVKLDFKVISPEAGRGKTGTITFTDKSTMTDKSAVLEGDYPTPILRAGYTTPYSSEGKSPYNYEAGSIWGAYNEKTCDELKNKSYLSDIINCKFLKAKNGKIGVVYNQIIYDTSYITVGYYFTGNAEYPLFGIEYYSPDDNFGDNLSIFQKVIESITTLTQTTTTQTISNETAGWKTYTSEKYGFEFKYPTTWIVGNDERVLQPPLDFNTPLERIALYSDGKSTYDYDYDLYIDIFPNDKSLSVEDFNKEVRNSDPSPTAFKGIEELIIDGQRAIKYKGEPSLTGSVTTLSISFKKILLEVYDVDDVYQQNGFLDKLISTFKFTN